MFLWHVFLVKPLAAVSVVICLATIVACVWLERKHRHQRSDRFLIAVLGLLSIYQGFRILEGIGIVAIAVGPTVDDAIELAITAFYLMAALVLRLSTIDHLDAESAIRLARAAPPRFSRQFELPRDLSRETVALETLNWAMPRLSDGAFKLYAFLCLRADSSTGRVAFNSVDATLQLGKAGQELDGHLAELQSTGAIRMCRQGNRTNIELLPQNQRNSVTSPHELATLATRN